MVVSLVRGQRCCTDGQNIGQHQQNIQTIDLSLANSSRRKFDLLVPTKSIRSGLKVSRFLSRKPTNYNKEKF